MEIDYDIKYEDNEVGSEVVEQSENNTGLNAHGGMFAPLSDRGICKDTAQKYGVKVIYGSDGTIAQHIYPYFISNEITATKTRYVRDKKFSCAGSFSGTGLFGENIFKEGGKYITLVEGECDAMAAYELLGSKWAVVSIKRGASSAVTDVKESLEFLESFENVVICFDNDPQGIKAAKKVAMLFQPSKAKIMSLPNGYKDANDMLRQNKHKEFIEAWWSAKVYTPSGVINVSESKADFFDREKKESVLYPWKELNEKLYGLRQGELVTLTGGTGLGKSSVTRELEHWLIKETTDNVGIISLEEDWRRTVDGILSIEANARLYIDQVREQFTPEEIDNFFNILYDGENEAGLTITQSTTTLANNAVDIASSAGDVTMSSSDGDDVLVSAGGGSTGTVGGDIALSAGWHGSGTGGARQCAHRSGLHRCRGARVGHDQPQRGQCRQSGERWHRIGDHHAARPAGGPFPDASERRLRAASSVEGHEHRGHRRLARGVLFAWG